ncbi:MAG: hypothetical protein O2955_22165 [Planctomycetota bacterium]|nr:hypothetical protein [Planctomycetota bacterium]MDA1215213.1 hypothetical protein [Planctomycetota bacterium]
MSTVAVIIGSEIRERGGRFLSRSDRAAVHIALNRPACSVVAFSIEPDDYAEQYARAAGVSTVELLESDHPFKFDLTIVGQGVVTRFGDIDPARIAASQEPLWCSTCSRYNRSRGATPSVSCAMPVKVHAKFCRSHYRRCWWWQGTFQSRRTFRGIDWRQSKFLPVPILLHGRNR